MSSINDLAISACMDQVLAKVSENKAAILEAMLSHEKMIELVATDTEFDEDGSEKNIPFTDGGSVDGYKIVKSCMAIALYVLSRIEEKSR